MKRLGIVAAFLCLLFLPAIVAAQGSTPRSIGPWSIYRLKEGLITVYFTDRCRVEINDEVKTIVIETNVNQRVYGPNAFIKESVGIDTSGPRPVLVYQLSWYERDEITLPGMKTIERGK